MKKQPRFKMMFASTGHILHAQICEYDNATTEELREKEKDLKQSVESRFTADKWNKLGAVRSALLRRHPNLVKPITSPARAGGSNKLQWRKVE